MCVHQAKVWLCCHLLGQMFCEVEPSHFLVACCSAACGVASLLTLGTGVHRSRRSPCKYWVAMEKEEVTVE